MDYFNTKLDPFQKEKNELLKMGVNSVAEKMSQLKLLKENKRLEYLLKGMLWGNRSDLSLSGGDITDEPMDVDKKYLLVDTSKEIIEKIEVGESVAIILDNCGVELVSDLTFALYLISEKKKVVFLYCSKLCFLFKYFRGPSSFRQ